MSSGVIIQARMSSSRLPGKVLKDLCGKPLIQYLLERVLACRSGVLPVVATSGEASDDPIEKFCREYGVPCYRGSLTDVAGRFVGVLDQFGFDAFVRICADSPFMDQHIIDRAVELFRQGTFDMVTNTLVRSFPKGESVEVVAGDVFRSAYAAMRDPDDFEHVTRYFHNHKEEFSIHNFSTAVDVSTLQLSVDTPEDFVAAERIIETMDRPHIEYGFEDIVKICQHLSSL